MNKFISLKTLALLAGPLAFICIQMFPPEELSHEGRSVLACTAWVAIWWVTEVVELAVTSLLPIVIFPLSGALSLEATTTSYGNPYIFLFMGGFIIGLAIEYRNLHKRIAFSIINKVGTGEKKLILGFMVATAFLSMWLSNTATAIMMLPIAYSVIYQFGHVQPFSRNLMLGIAYAASIGGIATLIGTPPNLILAGVIKSSFDVEISFFQWMIFGVPYAACMLLITYFFLTRFKPSVKQAISFAPLSPITVAEKRVLVVFVLTALLWITRSFLFDKILPDLDDTIIAIFGALMMFIIPSGMGDGGLIQWKQAKNLPWDVLLIFGAGLAIAKGFSQTDLATWLASHFIAVNVLGPFILTLFVVAGVNLLTEITSNTATASMMLPLLVSMGASLGIDPLPLMVGGVLSASCAFMLPVATPPNAVVFSSGTIRIKDMVKTGFWLNIMAILITMLFIQLVWPPVWGMGIFK